MLTSYDLCGPNPRPMTVPEVKELKRLVSTLGELPIIVNIGADIGISTMAMLEERPDSVILSIDTAPCEREFENLKNGGLDSTRVIRLLGRSAEIGSYWPCPVDFVFVDGDHSEKGVRADIETWLYKISLGGILAFHDYIPEPIPPEIKGRVVYAVDNLMSEYERIALCERLIAFRV